MHYAMTTAAASLALALMAARPAAAATTLHLSASATVNTMPDELEATLSANAEAPAPADAQARVNAMVSRALQAARAVAAVTVSTGSYSVWQVTNPHPAPHPEWHASQNVVLSAGDGAALLGLVGVLQGEGLAVSSLEWRLKPETEKKAHDQAETMALAALRQKAENTAKLLGMHFAGFRQIWLTQPPTPAPRPMAMMAARAMPEPNAVPAEASVTATVTAEATLVP